jgi:HAD superfamily hydrolase (TIGR01509 family)
MPQPIRAVLLDVDGTLIDSNEAHARSWVEAFREAGVEVPLEKVRRLIGMGGDKLMPAASGIEEDSPEGKRLADRRKHLFMEQYLPHLRAFPQTRALLDALQALGLKLVVATSAKSEELKGLLQVAGAPELEASATTSSDADASKPDPDIVEAAVARSGFPADQVVMIGDTPYDVEAATRAGVRLIAVRCGGWSDADLKGAIAVYDDPADLLAMLDHSPISEGAKLPYRAR